MELSEWIRLGCGDPGKVDSMATLARAPEGFGHIGAEVRLTHGFRGKI